MPAGDRALAAAGRGRSALACAGRRTVGIPVAVLRLSGIYGPGRNAFVNLAQGHRPALDQAGAGVQPHPRRRYRRGAPALDREPATAALSMSPTTCRRRRRTSWPCRRADGLARPPDIPFEAAQLSPMARSFYGENKRVSNRRLHQDFPGGSQLPTYREGLAAIKADAN